MKRWLFTKKIELKKELTFPFVDVLVYKVTPYYFDMKYVNFQWISFLTSKCIYVLDIILKSFEL